VKRKFSLGVSVQARDLTNLRVVLDTQHEHGQRPGAEHLATSSFFTAPEKETTSTRGQLCKHPYIEAI
jgi:hypothetical protein